MGDKTAKLSIRLEPNKRSFLEKVYKTIKERPGYGEFEEVGLNWRDGDSLGSFIVACAVWKAEEIAAGKTKPRK